MTQLAIKGHATRGKEVIEILEMFGGKNNTRCYGVFENRIYIIDKKTDEIIDVSRIFSDEYNLFTLEEFLEKYPYKIGDWVQHNGTTSCDSVYEIEEMQWEGGTVKYIVKQLGCCGYGKKIKIAAEHLQPYKEREKKSLLSQLIEYFRTTPKDELEREWNEHNELDEIGPTVEEYFAFVESIKKQPHYPKTYKECCDILHEYITQPNITGYKYELLHNLRKLIICRDAYWKIAGEQMGLGKPWEPDLENKDLYCLYNCCGQIIKSMTLAAFNKILIFPTEEMRDTFDENFQDLIESCKELL